MAAPVPSGHLSPSESAASHVGYLHDFKNGKVTRIEDFLDTAEALEAAGLSE
jgi:ketosteroid isomerase-like protein